MAAERGDLGEVTRLLASGVDPDGRDGLLDPLTQAASSRENTEVVQALLAAGADPNGRVIQEGVCWATPLGRATSNDHVEIARLLLEAGAAISTQCSGPQAGFLSIPMLELLAEYGLDLKGVDEFGRNQLHLAFHPEDSVPDPEVVDYLIQAGVPVNGRDESGRTPLAYWHVARSYERFSVQRWLTTLVLDESDYVRNLRSKRGQISEILEDAEASL